MIRYKDKTFDQWSICPATGDIFDAKTGEIQSVKIYGDRPYFKGMSVHRIMAHTFYGYKPGFDVHHKDENKLNNSLSNLVYLTHGEHCRLHAGELLHDETRAKVSASMKGRPKSLETKAKISASMKGKPKSEETKAKMSAAKKGKSPWNKGKQWSEETKAKLSAAHKGKHFSEESKAKISAALKLA